LSHSKYIIAFVTLIWIGSIVSFFQQKTVDILKVDELMKDLVDTIKGDAK